MSFPIVKYITIIQYLCIYTHLLIHTHVAATYIPSHSCTLTQTHAECIYCWHNNTTKSHYICPLRCEYGTSLPIFGIHMLGMCIISLYLLYSCNPLQSKRQKISILNELHVCSYIMCPFWTLAFDSIRFLHRIVVEINI